MKLLRVTLDIEIDATEDRDEEFEPAAEDYSAPEVADLIAGHVMNDDEMWGGSMMWSRVSTVSVISSEWNEDDGS